MCMNGTSSLILYIRSQLKKYYSKDVYFQTILSTIVCIFSVFCYSLSIYYYPSGYLDIMPSNQNEIFFRALNWYLIFSILLTIPSVLTRMRIACVPKISKKYFMNPNIFYFLFTILLSLGILLFILFLNKYASLFGLEDKNCFYCILIGFCSMVLFNISIYLSTYFFGEMVSWCYFGGSISFLIVTYISLKFFNPVDAVSLTMCTCLGYILNFLFILSYGIFCYFGNFKIFKQDNIIDTHEKNIKEEEGTKYVLSVNNYKTRLLLLFIVLLIIQPIFLDRIVPIFFSWVPSNSHNHAIISEFVMGMVYTKGTYALYFAEQYLAHALPLYILIIHLYNVQKNFISNMKYYVSRIKVFLMIGYFCFIFVLGILMLFFDHIGLIKNNMLLIGFPNDCIEYIHYGIFLWILAIVGYTIPFVFLQAILLATVEINIERGAESLEKNTRNSLFLFFGTIITFNIFMIILFFIIEIQNDSVMLYIYTYLLLSTFLMFYRYYYLFHEIEYNINHIEK